MNVYFFMDARGPGKVIMTDIQRETGLSVEGMKYLQKNLGDPITRSRRPLRKSELTTFQEPDGDDHPISLRIA